MRVWMAAVAACVFVVSLDAQSTSTLSGNESAKASLPREVALEMELQIARDERDQILNRYEALQLQAQQLSAIVDQFIAQAQAGRIEQGNQQRQSVAERLVRALGGDPAAGDTWDWKAIALRRKDGTVIPVARLDAPRKEGR